MPTLVAYKVSPISCWIGRRVLKVRWISLTNLILGRASFPEHIQEDADPGPLAARMASWLAHPEKLEAIRRDTDELRILCGEGGSAERAARALWRDMASLPPPGRAHSL